MRVPFGIVKHFFGWPWLLGKEEQTPLTLLTFSSRLTIIESHDQTAKAQQA
jgi:hypothetical protein